VQREPSEAPTFSVEQLTKADLSGALFTLEDLPVGSNALIVNQDYVTSTVLRLILCGEDARRELDVLTGRLAQFEGPQTSSYVNQVVNGLPGDFAERLIDWLEEVWTTCDRTWTGPGLNDRSTEFEVVGSFPLPDLLDQRLALEISHGQQGEEDVRLFLVNLRMGLFLSAFTLLLAQGSGTDIVANLASTVARKLERAVLPG
jgi:hypothetical protein